MVVYQKNPRSVFIRPFIAAMSRKAAKTGVMEEAIAPASEMIELRGFELKIIRFAGKMDIDILT